jgi:hypothetical protein
MSGLTDYLNDDTSVPSPPKEKIIGIQQRNSHRLQVKFIKTHKKPSTNLPKLYPALSDSILENIGEKSNNARSQRTMSTETQPSNSTQESTTNKRSCATCKENIS